MATGAGGIGNESIDTLMKDLRRRFSGADANVGSLREQRTRHHRLHIDQTGICMAGF
jgi:hypothetical protein